MSTPINTTFTSPALSLKAPRRPFGKNAQTTQLVFFLHPGYADNHNILLTLPGFDSGGIHHATAHTACAIFANCRWDGFLSVSRNGPRLSVGPDDVLPPGRYYFCIEDEEQYPVVPTFDHFLCPTNIPSSYTSAPILSSPADDVIRRDITCRITASALPNETAHIIPASQNDWWQRNSMFLHTANPGQGLDTRCADNTILLRRDLHKMWDDNKFVIVPKAGKWVVHVLWNSSVADILEYHNLELQPLAGVSRHFFLCRFALAILSNSPFLGQRVPRKLLIVDECSTEVQIRNMTADEYQRKFSRANSRSQSPRKRQRSAPGNEVDGRYPLAEGEDGQDQNDEEDERGRSRKRKRLTETDYDPSFEKLNKNVAVTSDILCNQTPGLCQKRRRSSEIIYRLQTPPRSTSPASL
ncbi:hypothetical protein BDV59DRAFT_188898 [Aspergillus ambiguus]|uniref:HNH endonuclease signature motif containing protein n=1 Tax=Aspergillus ambiguus TaxID=176160 RepID=UPI003CCDE407